MERIGLPDSDLACDGYRAMRGQPVICAGKYPGRQGARQLSLHAEAGQEPDRRIRDILSADRRVGMPDCCGQ